MAFKKILPGDPTQYPGNDPSGYFTTFDVVRIFPEIKMEKLQDWLRRGFIEPMYRVECPTGAKNYFTPSQLYMIAVFQKLLNFGIRREYAAIQAKAFHNLRADLKEQAGPNAEPNFIVIEKGEIGIRKMTVFDKSIELEAGVSGNDFIVFNMFDVTSKIRREMIQ